MKDDKLVDDRIEFFDSIADQWDEWHDLPLLDEKFHQEFDRFGIHPYETVLDVGCGTGNLTQTLLKRLDSDGLVIAVDISPLMLECALAKISDPRVSWLHNSAEKISVKDQSCDRILCFTAWPHFADREAVVAEFYRLLKPDGCVHVFHFISRAEVNHIHAEAHPSVHTDLLEPVGELASLFERGGFTVLDRIDDDSQYRLTVRKGTSV